MRDGLERNCVKVPEYESVNTIEEKKNYTVAIVVGSIGGVVLITAIVLGIYCFKKHRNEEDDDRMDSMIYNKDKQQPNVVVTKSEPDYDMLANTYKGPSSIQVGAEGSFNISEEGA